MLLHMHKWFVFTFAVPCPVGEFSRSGLMPCYPCPQDYYQPNPGKSFCLSCPFYGTTTITGARSITDCSSKMLHFISYIIPSWRLLLISVVASILNITVFSGFECLDLLNCPFDAFFDDNVSKILVLGMLNLITSNFLSKSLGFKDISHPSLCFLFLVLLKQNICGFTHSVNQNLDHSI